MIFNKNFDNLDTNLIINEIKNKGYFSFDEAMTSDFINQILKDVKNQGKSFNSNKISGVDFSPGNQFFLTHMMAVSKIFYKFCTHNYILNICTNFFNNDKFRIKAFRYYENFGGQNMQWHTDNKSQTNKNDTRGLIIIVYLSDVFDGEFQFIEGSQEWSSKNQVNDYSNDYINKNFSKDIVSFKKKAGSIVIYNTYGIHRAKPSKDKDFIRKSLFIQIDENLDIATPLYINTEFIENLDDKIKTYLGFGLKANQNVYPNSSMKTLPLNRDNFIIFYNWIKFRITSKILSILPGFIRKKLRK